MITISFWALLYTEEKYGDRWYLNHYEHTMPLLMCVLDVAMSPYRRIDLVKGYQPFLAGVAYLVFSLLFELGGGKNALGD